jgi:hypothetical protein
MSPSKHPLHLGPRPSRGICISVGLGWVHTRAVLQLPIAWASAVLLLAWPGLHVFSPTGITVHPSDTTGLVYELAFLGTVLGAATGLAGIQRNRWLNRPLESTEAWLAEISALGCLGLLFAGSATLIPVCQGLAGPRLAWTALLTAAHLAALGSMLLSVPMPRGLRPALLVALAWWIPALALGQELDPLTGRLWAARYLIDTPTARWADTVHVVAFVLASWLLATATSGGHRSPSPAPSPSS